MKSLCKNIDIYDDMIVIFRGKKCTVKQAIDECKPGEPIEGIHPHQYDKLLKLFENKRQKKFQYSVDIRHGDWRFILFDTDHRDSLKLDQIKYHGACEEAAKKFKLPEYVKPIPI